MNDWEVSDSATPASKTPTYSQAGTIGDASLSGLRDQIKNIMIPMLIKIFQLKLELSQSISLPSRLQNMQRESPESTLAELQKLDEDLKLLALWCQSCRNQVSKALSIPEEEQKETLAATSSETDPNPMVSKSFSDAVTSQSNRYKVAEPSTSPSLDEESASPAPNKPRWWHKIFQS